MANISLPYSLVKYSLHYKRESYLKVLAALRVCDIPKGYGGQFRHAPASRLSTLTGLSKSTVRQAMAHWVGLRYIFKLKGKQCIYSLKGNQKIHQDLMQKHPSWVEDCCAPGGMKIKIVRYDLETIQSYDYRDLFFHTYLSEEAFRQRNGRKHRFGTRRNGRRKQGLDMSFQLALRTIAERLNLHWVTVSKKLHKLSDMGLLSIYHDLVTLPAMPGVRCDDLHGLYQCKFKRRIFVPARDGFAGWGPNQYSISPLHSRKWVSIP